VCSSAAELDVAETEGALLRDHLTPACLYFLLNKSIRATSPRCPDTRPSRRIAQAFALFSEFFFGRRRFSTLIPRGGASPSSLSPQGGVSLRRCVRSVFTERFGLLLGKLGAHRLGAALADGVWSPLLAAVVRAIQEDRSAPLSPFRDPVKISGFTGILFLVPLSFASPFFLKTPRLPFALLILVRADLTTRGAAAFALPGIWWPAPERRRRPLPLPIPRDDGEG